MKLSEISKNQSFLIDSLEELSETEQIRLLEIGVLPGKSIIKLQSSVLNGPVSFEIEGNIIALSKKDTERILVVQH